MVDKLSIEEVAVVKALQKFKKDHGVIDSHRILDGGKRGHKDRLGATNLHRRLSIRHEGFFGPSWDLVSSRGHDGRIFHNTVDEVAALPTIKKDFEADTEKLKADEVKMTEALRKVKTLTDENIRLKENNTKLAEEVAQLKAELVAKKTEAIQAVLDKQKVVEDVEIKFLNPGVELQTKGMSTLCIVHNDKWYHDVGKYFVEDMLGDEEITPPPIKPIPLKEDVERE
ncbi:PAS domain S-box protein [Sesbania bispinosa]|nr:PAS domain S-box protein [Sesbania bispinosa]